MDEKTLQGLLKLNQLALTEEETASVFSFFDASNAAEQAMLSVDTESIPVTVHLMPLTNVFREDISSQPFPREALQTGAPESMDGYWQVPRLVD